MLLNTVKMTNRGSADFETCRRGVIGQLRSLWETNISNSGAIGNNVDKCESESESESESSSESSESESSSDEARGP